MGEARRKRGADAGEPVLVAFNGGGPVALAKGAAVDERLGTRRAKPAIDLVLRWRGEVRAAARQVRARDARREPEAVLLLDPRDRLGAALAEAIRPDPSTRTLDPAGAPTVLGFARLEGVLAIIEGHEPQMAAALRVLPEGRVPVFAVAAGSYAIELVAAGPEGADGAPSPAGDRGGYRHPEAFCLMRYRGQESGELFTVWNSRDGVTPWSVRHPDTGEELRHLGAAGDRCAPDHKPGREDLVFVDLTREAALAKRRRWVVSVWERPRDGGPPLRDTYPGQTWEQVAEHFADGDVARPGQPNLVHWGDA